MKFRRVEGFGETFTTESRYACMSSFGNSFLKYLLAQLIRVYPPVIGH